MNVLGFGGGVGGVVYMDDRPLDSSPFVLGLFFSNSAFGGPSGILPRWHGGGVKC